MLQGFRGVVGGSLDFSRTYAAPLVLLIVTQPERFRGCSRE